MPPKKNPETQAEQSARFKKDAQKLIDDGKLNPIEADAALDRLVSQQKISETKAGTIPQKAVEKSRRS
jgi:polyhydroxyalkanoate synthesis regulator phasin